MPYIPRNQRGKRRRATSQTARTSEERRDTTNQNALNKLREEGLLEDFMKQRDKISLWDYTKKVGSAAFDIIMRGSYAVGGAIEEVSGGDPGISGREELAAAKRVGKELFSGIGGLKGEKVAIPEAFREAVPQYGRWAEKHPIASIGTDLALDVGLDPTTYAGGALVRGAAKGIKTTTKAVGATKTAQKVSKAISPITKPVKELGGRMFTPGYLWKKKGASKGYDILWSEKHFAQGMSSKLAKRINPAIEEIATWDVGKQKAFVKVMYGDIPLEQVPEDVARISASLKKTLTTMGRRESKYAGKGTEHLLENYFPNNPKQFTELMENVGEYLPSGRGGGGLMLYKTTSDRQKVLRTGDDFLNWLKTVGVKDENLGDVIIKNLQGRAGQSVAKVRKIRIHHKMVRDLPEVFEELPFGTKKVWSLTKEGQPIVKPGNTLWMPYGNLKFFPQDVIRQNKNIQEAISTGKGLVLSADELGKLSTKMVGVTTRVKAYQVPMEIVEDLDTVSRKLVDKDGVVKVWDGLLNVFKNTAIASPFFHVRNFISSGFQSYLADINPKRFKDGWQYLYNKWQGKAGAKVMGRTVGAWDELFGRYGISGGSFVGQQTGITGIPGAEKLFKFNREVLGRNIEEFHRASLFMDGIQKGMKPEAAAKLVKKFHFDYGELTTFEQTFMRRVMPFYAWTRKNVPLQLEMLFKAPDKYRNIAKLKRAVGGAPEGEYNPEWWKEQDVWETKGGFGVHVGLPYADLNQVLTNPTGATGPFGMIGNVARNFDPFYRKDITEFKGQTTPLVAGKYANVPPKAKYVIENALPIIKRYGTDFSEELYSVFSGDDPDWVNKLKVIKKIIGVGILPKLKTREERTRIYRLRDELDDYKAFREQEGY